MTRRKRGFAFRDPLYPELTVVSIMLEAWMHSLFGQVGLSYDDFYKKRVELSHVGVKESNILNEFVRRYAPWVTAAYLEQRGDDYVPKRGIEYILYHRCRNKLVRPGYMGIGDTRCPSELMSLTTSRWRRCYEAVIQHWDQLQKRGDAREIIRGISCKPIKFDGTGWVYVNKYPEGHYKVGYTMESVQSRCVKEGTTQVEAIAFQGKQTTLDAETLLKHETQHYAIPRGHVLCRNTTEDRMFDNDEHARHCLLDAMLSKSERRERAEMSCMERRTHEIEIAKQHLRSNIQALAGGVDNCAQRRNYEG